MEQGIIFKIADTETDFAQAAGLFKLYADSLRIDLAFQNFDNELQVISQQYNKPTGALLLAYDEDKPIACAGVRKLEHGIAELKRMYVTDAYRGRKLGSELLEQCLSAATNLGYGKIRLDTLSDMTAAISLYTSRGFVPIPPYCFNPHEDTIYMEKEL
jgi:putative acetyltransferase